MKSSKRIEFIDLAKGLCILLVVWQHTASTFELPTYPFKVALSSFRMPLYFFLSGLFFKNYENFFGFVKRKTNKLLIPFVFFYIATSVFLPYILAYFHLRPAPGEGALWAFFWKEYFPNIPIWFLLGLFWTNLMFYFILFLSKKFHARLEKSMLIFFSIFLGLFGRYMGKIGLNLPMFLDTAMTSVPFFCAGYLTCRHTKILYPNILDKFNIPLSVLGFFLTFLLASATVSYSENKFELPAVSMYLCGLMGTFSVLLLSKTIRRIPLISYFGRYSIIILLTHGWILWGIIKVLKEYEIHWTKNQSLAFIFITTMLSYIVLIPFFKKFLPYFTAQKDLIPILKTKP